MDSATALKLKVATGVTFRNLKQTVIFGAFLSESTKLSDVLDVHRSRASNKLEIIKADLRKRCDQVGFPIIISLSDIGKTITREITA